MTASRTHRLEGLEPDNLLAFLALLGLLRALEAAGWHPRAHWEGTPLRPVLTLTEERTREEVVTAAENGCLALAADYDFDAALDLTFSATTGRAMLERAVGDFARGRAAVLDSLFSDGAITRKGNIQQAPLCSMVSGTGHQHFLARLAAAPRRAKPSQLKPVKGKATEQTRQPPIFRALFGEWQRVDDVPALRWDPLEDRRYALRFGNPSNTSKNPILTEDGANILAAIGLPALAGAATKRGSRVRFLNIGSELYAGNDVRLTWPLWTASTSLTAIRAMVAHPELVSESPDLAELKRFSILEVRRASRIEREVAAGVYINFTRAERV